MQVYPSLVGGGKKKLFPHEIVTILKTKTINLIIIINILMRL